MPSVLGLLEERELAARERVDGLREEADRVLAELAEAETDWEDWVVARQRVGQVLSAPRAEPAAKVDSESPQTSATCEPVETAPEVVPPQAARAGSVVPVWRPGLPVGSLAVDYQRIMALLIEHRHAGGSGMMSCQEITAEIGSDVVSAQVEGVRVKAKRLVGRGWLAEPAPGRFTLAAGPAAAS
ncbi:hypothetical protein [Kitasatospora sp. NPDC050543]|uniref:hypothetical protein n=1 Tax=Kitasatospora sp. NPDC050543 TaxID=3364054 RepID=UPI00379B8936